jgi:hypothetical protein
METIAVEEIERMPFDLDIRESIVLKRSEARAKIAAMPNSSPCN